MSSTNNGKLEEEENKLAMLCSKGIIKFFFNFNAISVIFWTFETPNKQWDPNNHLDGNRGTWNLIGSYIFQLANKQKYLIVKFIYSEKDTKFCEIFPLLLTVCTVVKSKGKISQNFVAFSEYIKF